MNKAWLYVALTSFFELVWIYGFNVASAWWHWIFIVFFIFVDFHFITKAAERLPTGTVYAIFAEVGTDGTALMDVLFCGETLSAVKIYYITNLFIYVISFKLHDVIV